MNKEQIEALGNLLNEKIQIKDNLPALKENVPKAKKAWNEAKSELSGFKKRIKAINQEIKELRKTLPKGKRGRKPKTTTEETKCPP
jgi:archaellum component FlaC